jgi:hypothetical protein
MLTYILLPGTNAEATTLNLRPGRDWPNRRNAVHPAPASSRWRNGKDGWRKPFHVVKEVWHLGRCFRKLTSTFCEMLRGKHIRQAAEMRKTCNLATFPFLGECRINGPTLSKLKYALSSGRSSNGRHKRWWICPIWS